MVETRGQLARNQRGERPDTGNGQMGAAQKGKRTNEGTCREGATGGTHSSCTRGISAQAPRLPAKCGAALAPKPDSSREQLRPGQPTRVPAQQSMPGAPAGRQIAGQARQPGEQRARPRRPGCPPAGPTAGSLVRQVEQVKGVFNLGLGRLVLVQHVAPRPQVVGHRARRPVLCLLGGDGGVGGRWGEGS